MSMDLSGVLEALKGLSNDALRIVSCLRLSHGGSTVMQIESLLWLNEKDVRAILNVLAGLQIVEKYEAGTRELWRLTDTGRTYASLARFA